MAACRVDAPATGSGSSTGRRSAEEPPRAVGHARGLFEITVRRIVDVPAAESASAGIVCSGEASARYLTALLGAGDAPIDASVRETLFAPRVVAEGPGVGEDAFYTLGWLREGYGADTVLWHTGSALTMQAAFRIYPEQGIGVFAAANVNGPMLYGFANQLAAGVYDTFEGREGQPFRTLEMARTTRVVVTAATSASLLWLLISINAFRLRRRRRALPVRGRRDILRVVGLPLVVDALVLLFFFSGVPAGFQVGFLELSAVALDLFMLGLLAGVPVAVWAVARTALLLGSPKPRRR
jgi:hypothetical protein